MSCFKERILYEFVENNLVKQEKEKIEDHLKECNACKEKVEELSAFERDLNVFWREFRKKCPAPEDMYAYGLGRLNKNEIERISKHLQLCHICKLKYEESQEMAEELEKIAASGIEEKMPEGFLSETKKVILQKIADAINSVEKASAFSKSFGKLWKSHFQYDKPIGSRFLVPGPIYVAASGRGYGKEVIQQEDSPFKVESIQFGKTLNIILRTESELFKDSIVKFQLFEKEKERHSGVLFVSGGIGKQTINLEDIIAPEEEPYRISLDVLSAVDILSDIKDPSSSTIFMELMRSGDEKVMKMITEIIEKRESQE